MTLIIEPPPVPPLASLAAKQLVEKVEHERTQGMSAFFELPFTQDALVSKIHQIKTRIQATSNHLIIIGIGGSDLGARFLVSCLQKITALSLHFISTPDPDELHECLLAIQNDYAHTSVLVISKSGSTLESVSLFLLMKQRFEEALPTSTISDHFFIISDKNSPLSMIAHDHSYTWIEHPQTIGGRFSILSVVGLLPAACAGISIETILKGARSMETERRTLGPKHVSVQFAHAHHQLTMQGYHEHVCLPYSYALRLFPMWYRQLWAETLGKNTQAPTPLAAHGPVDQHSQLQLYSDGPKNKVLTFLSVLQHQQERDLEITGHNIPIFSYIANKRVSQIIDAEEQGTRLALQDKQIPVGQIKLKTINEESIGELIQFYLSTTIYLATLMRVDPFSQPGVEASKQRARSILQSIQV